MLKTAEYMQILTKFNKKQSLCIFRLPDFRSAFYISMYIFTFYSTEFLY